MNDYTDPQKLDLKIQLKEVSFFMSKKYDFEFKLKIVEEYLSGGGGINYLTAKYSLTSSYMLRTWITAYKTHGSEGLFRKREKKKYDLQFKLHAVQWYLTTEISYKELAIQLDIPNPSLLCRWVSNFRKYGIDGISDKPKGRPTAMPKKKDSPTKEIAETASSYSERIKELEQKLLHLEIENAFLKELRRLRLEEEATKSSQGLSAVSEENTD